MKKTFLFYDLETSGLNKCFDQVLQFAAIRTDLDLNELERYEIFVKLNPGVVPSPQAVLVNGITLDQIQNGKCEYEAIKEVHNLFNTPGTISIGYNSLGFDDEFLRFSFYRNLLTPYTHQYANDCGRMDLYPMAVLYFLFKPEGVNWPKIDDVATLKLEHLSRANNLMEGSAHDAMNDVLATLRLARLFKKEEKMWEYLCGSFDKRIDLERLKKLSSVDDEYQQAILVNGNLGNAKFYQNYVIGLGLHNHYKNQSLWLPLDEVQLFNLDKNDLIKKVFVNRKRFGESPILLPVTERFKRYFSKERMELVEKNVGWLRENKQVFLDLIDYHKDYKYPEIPDLDIDAALYQIGFKTNQEERECFQFKTVSPKEKLDLIDSFSNQEQRVQAIRVLGRNYPDILAKNESLYKEFQDYLMKIRSEQMVNYKNEIRLLPEVALTEIEDILQTRSLSSEEDKLLEGFAKYIRSL